MKNSSVEINPGEIKVTMDQPVTGKFTLRDLGISNQDLMVEGGNLRLVFEMGNLGDLHFYKMPTLELAYRENAHESGWVVEFNGENILEKTDHSGHATVLLLHRNKLDEYRHRHLNTLILHGDLSEQVQLSADNSFFNLLETPGN
ncbi:MAG: hypothetical protein H6581_31015 [Bacteroidia bacterium]|nr:hypothetical protein [Bacteroidia bacterium]